MAYSISICDTHRLPYFNATLVAYKIGTTAPIKFKHGKDGEPQYSDLKTNARGYICDTDGTILSRGVFVAEDALIKITLGDGTTTEWEVCADSDVSVNDGKLLGKKNKDSADDDLEEKWSSNSAENYTLDYDHLIHKPDINEWAEVEQVVTMDTPVDEIHVDKYAKSMTVQFDQICCPSSWEWDGSDWKLKTGMSDKPNAEWSLKLIADPDRVAQVICIRNWTPWRLAIKNAQGQIIAVLDPTALDMGKFVTLYGITEPTLPYHGTLDIEKLASAHPIVFGAGVLENTATNPIVIDDYTPDTMVVKFEAAYNFEGYPVKLFLKSGVSKSRVIRLWLQNFKTNKGLIICDVGNSNMVIGIIANFTVVDLIVSPDGLVKVSDYVKTQGTQLALDGSKSQTLPPDATFIVGSTDGNYYISTLDDNYTDKMIYGIVANTSSREITLTLNVGGNEYKLPLLPGVQNSFVLHKMGTQVCIIKPTAGTNANKYYQLTPMGESSNDYYYKVSKTVATQDTICINVPYLMQLNGQGLADFGSSSENENLVFDVSDLISEGQTITLKMKVDSYCKYVGATSKEPAIGFGTRDTHQFNVFYLSDQPPVGGGMLVINRKNLVVQLTLSGGNYSAVVTVEDNQE